MLPKYCLATVQKYSSTAAADSTLFIAISSQTQQNHARKRRSATRNRGVIHRATLQLISARLLGTDLECTACARCKQCAIFQVSATTATTFAHIYLLWINSEVIGEALFQL